MVAVRLLLKARDRDREGAGGTASVRDAPARTPLGHSVPKIHR